jgi:hypothetical protein
MQFARARIIETPVQAGSSREYPRFSVALALGPCFAPVGRVIMKIPTRPSKMLSADALRHNFVVGPLHKSDVTGEDSHLFFCARCRWRFLVSDSGVVVLGDDGGVMSGSGADLRFDSFERGPCPALEAMNREWSPIAAPPPSAKRPRFRDRHAAVLRLVAQGVRSSGPKL